MSNTTQGSTLLRLAANDAGQFPQPGFRNMWLTPFLVLIAVATLVFAALYRFDIIDATGDPVESFGVIDKFLQFDPGLLTDALPSLGMTMVAVLGIVLTVVSIIVQLSSDRYTGVTMMFMRDPVNIAVISYYVMISLFAVWLSVSLKEDFVPIGALVFMLFATSFGLALMLPYFTYVFWFLDPGNIIDRIRYKTAKLANQGGKSASAKESAILQQEMLQLMEEITDIANNSIHGRDKIITGLAVDSLRTLVLEFMARKPEGEHHWYQIGDGIRKNPDFVAMDAESMQNLESSRCWVEWKVLRQYLGIYNEALDSMQDINYLIAINTRYIGEAAASVGEHEVVDMSFRFMNSYLRAAINARGIRTAYNILHQYRMLIESMLTGNHGQYALKGVNHLKYYGHLAFDNNLAFIAETVAYDLSALCQFAHAEKMPEHDKILKQFLDMDRPTRGHRQERSLSGVRKAQAKLATYYLLQEEEALARLIAEDMISDSPESLQVIRDELASVDSLYFWEIIDRGRNFEYLPTEQREQLSLFFNWLNAPLPPRRRATDR